MAAHVPPAIVPSVAIQGIRNSPRETSSPGGEGAVSEVPPLLTPNRGGGARLNPLAQQTPLAEPLGGYHPATSGSQLTKFVSTHPGLAANQPGGVNRTDKVRFSAPEVQKGGNASALTSIATSPCAGSGKVSSFVLGHRPGGWGQQDSEETDYLGFGSPQQPADQDLSLKNSETTKNGGNIWRRIFIRIGSAHEMNADFNESIVAPNLQYGDRLLERFYMQEYHHKRMKGRVVFMCCFGIALILFQLWLGFSNAIRLRKGVASKKLAALASFPYEEDQAVLFGPSEDASSLLVRSSGLIGGRNLWNARGGTGQAISSMSFYATACVDQALVDLVVLCIWVILVYIPNMLRRMEVISIVAQLVRTVLLIYFAQGMYSPCALQQGPTNIIMNNMAVAAANIAVFNLLGLARVRRSCFISLAWLAGIVEVCIVISGNNQGVLESDVPQLSLFIFTFAVIPFIAFGCRYRAEVSEREALFYAVMLEHTRSINTNLSLQLDELEKVKGMDIESALPEGVVPSQIVHVAVMELILADKIAEALQTNLIVAPLNHLNATSSTGRHVTPATITGKYPLIGRYTPHMPLNRRDSVAAASTPSNLRVAVEAASEIKARIACALKLLSRSHEVYEAKPKDPYQGAMMFHAIGHNAASYQQPTTPRLQSVKSQSTPFRSSTRISPLQMESTSPILQDFPYLHDMPFLSGLGDFARNIGQSWHFDLLRVARLTKDQALATTAMLLASPIVERLPWAFDWKRYYAFVRVIQNEYGPSDKIPYHNRTHGAFHAHTTSVLLGCFGHSESASALESLSVLIASLCHDVGHPGKTNAYLVNANRRLAIIYNDLSVLENVHACKCFETLQLRESNFLFGADNEDYRYFRKMVIDLILATDMKLHFELLNSFALRRNGAEFKPLDDDNRTLTLKVIMKAADLSHGAMDWGVHQQLSMAVNEEFWAQGDAEEKLGLPKSPLCDRAKSDELATQQIGFLEFVVMPLYAQLASVDPSGFVSTTCEASIVGNIAKWKVLATSQTTSRASRDCKQTQSPRTGSSKASSHRTRTSVSSIRLSQDFEDQRSAGYELISPVTEQSESARPFREAPASDADFS